jgi:Na+/pantothenate symporter
LVAACNLLNLHQVHASIFYSAVQLLASAALFNEICGVPMTVGALFTALIVWFYIVPGGMYHVEFRDPIPRTTGLAANLQHRYGALDAGNRDAVPNRMPRCRRIPGGMTAGTGAIHF